jgi:hypothetical protein
LIFVSHDREFVASLATPIIEMTPDGIVDFKGNYDDYLRRQGRYADDDTVAESAVRTAVERRLAKAGIAVDGLSAVSLIVNVAAERNRSEDGRCVFARFIVSLSLREPVSAERAPGEVFPATTWHVRGLLWRFAPGAPRQAVMDLLQDHISTFLRARGVDDHTHTSKPEHP